MVGNRVLRGLCESRPHQLWSVGMGRSCFFLGCQFFRMSMSPLAGWKMESHPKGALGNLLWVSW